MKKLFLLNLLAVSVLVPTMKATSLVYDFSVAAGTVNANNLPVSGSSEFTITDSGCFSGAGNTCVLVDILNNQAGISKVNQSISDLRFHLFNSGSEVLSNGILYSLWYSDAAQNPVQVQNAGGAPANAADNTVQRWALDTFDPAVGMHLDAVGSGQPDHLIGCCGQSQFNAYLTGHVIFEIDGISGLSVANSTVSGVQFSYGTTAGEFVTPGTCFNCEGGTGPQAIPEPYSLSLVGGGLIGLGLYRRRKRMAA